MSSGNQVEGTVSGNNQQTVTEAGTTLYCANHPGRETVLRCNRCDKPICYDCAVLTEVGYRCKECVRGQRAKYYNGNLLDPVIGAVIAFILGAVVGALAFLFLGIFGLFGFLIALFAGPAAGGIIAEAVRWSVQRRRARHMNLVVIVASVAGLLLAGLILPLRSIIRLDVLLFAIGMVSTIYARLL